MLGFLLAPTRWFWDGDVRGLHEIRFKRSPRICYSGSLLRIPVHVFEDGYVALETRNRTIAVERGNALQFSVGLLSGSPSEPVTVRSLENIAIESGERRLTGRNSLCQLRNVFSVDEDMRKEWEAGLMGRVFDTRELPIVFDFSNKILGFHTPALATRHLETSYHFAMGDWTASLLLGWSLIEQVLDEEFTLRHISEGKSRKSAARKLRNMTERDVIASLSEGPPLTIGDHDPTVLSTRILQRVEKLRLLRNDVVHKGRIATCGGAKRMKWGSERAVWRLFRQHNFDYGRYIESIRPVQLERNRRLWGDNVKIAVPKKNPCARIREMNH